jgi:5-methylcytosine-specific restriction endonuclease McrA
MPGVYAKKPGGNKKRTDRAAGNRALFDANRKIILATQSICAICGRPVNKSLKYPDPMSPTVDHIIPVSKNGDPVSLDNLQLAHRICNRQKSDKIYSEHRPVNENRKLPLSCDWKNF